MADSPSTTNYFQGTGYMKFTPTGGVERDLGNIVECELTPSSSKLEHKSTRQGKKATDFTQYNEQAFTLRIVLDEITPENLALAMLGAVDDVTDGTKTVRLGSVSTVTGSITFTGTNDVGNQVDGNFPSVSFGPSGSFSPISGDDFGQLEITGDLLFSAETSDFGTMTVREAA